MSILDDLIKDIDKEQIVPEQTQAQSHSMFSHSEQFEKYVKGENIGVADDKGK